MELPALGLGTYRLKGAACTEIVTQAIKLGYRLLDTARCYKNEYEIGIAIANSGVPREELFITSKIPPTEHGEDRAYDSVMDSLQRLNVPYLDLMLIHWPGVSKQPLTSPDNLELRRCTWRGLIKAKKDGLVRHIGVSNFTIAHLSDFMGEFGTEDIPVLNQFEFHPFCQQLDLVKYCHERNIIVQAYSSFGQNAPDLVGHPVLTEIAQEYQISTYELLLVWALQQHITVVPKASTADRLRLNFNVLGKFRDGKLRLSDDDLHEISKLDHNKHYCWNPHNVF